MDDPGRATDLFLSLTPDKVLAAVEAAGLKTHPVCYPLNSFENRVYEVELLDRTRVIVKFYRPGRWSREQILEEHRFLDDLAAAELPVCAVRRFANGSTLERIDHIDYCLFERIGGRAPDELRNIDAERLGRYIARMHTVGADRPSGTRPRLDADRYVRQPLAWMRENGRLRPPWLARYETIARTLADVYEERAEGIATHRIHADLHLGNLLFRDDRLWVLDFDDCADGPAVQDLWLALPGRDDHSLRLRARMLGAYEEMRLFDPRGLRLIEPLRGLRMIRYTGWLARRWHDPVFQRTWPEFDTDDYWRQSTEDLEELLTWIRRDEPATTTIDMATTIDVEDATELTNKDYFWDWEGD